MQSTCFSNCCQISLLQISPTFLTPNPTGSPCENICQKTNCWSIQWQLKNGVLRLTAVLTRYLLVLTKSPHWQVRTRFPVVPKPLQHVQASPNHPGSKLPTSLYPLLLVFRSTTRQFTTQFDHGTVDWIVVFTFCSSRGSKARAAATSTSHKDWVTSSMPASPREILQTVGRPP